MSRVLLGTVSGLVFGVIDVAIMLPMSFSRFEGRDHGGFHRAVWDWLRSRAAQLPWPGWAAGLCFGLLLGVPDTLTTKAYAPIIGMGTLGGIVIGLLVHGFGEQLSSSASEIG